MIIILVGILVVNSVSVTLLGDKSSLDFGLKVALDSSNLSKMILIPLICKCFLLLTFSSGRYFNICLVFEMSFFYVLNFYSTN